MGKRKAIKSDNFGLEVKEKIPKFDNNVGNLEEIIPEINVIQYVENRAAELQMMMTQSKKRNGNKNVFQKLPNHMRRRAASHNTKRLPIRLRHNAEQEIEHNPTVKTKRPSRKHRRRPKNIMKAYMNRQFTKFWLETHIWHAKRFKMEELWNFKIPMQPTDKGERASYRSCKQNCTIQDISYYECIEIIGPQSEIIAKLINIFSYKIGLTLKAKSVISGDTVGSSIVYKNNKYPFSPIGYIDYIWNPIEIPADNEIRILLIFVHPSTFVELFEEILSICQIQFPDVRYENFIENQKNNIPEDFLMHKFFSLTSFCSNGLKISGVSKRFNRFRLSGPLSWKILKETVRLVSVNTQNEDAKDLWWNEVYKNLKLNIILQKQISVLNSKNNVSNFRDGCILGLTVGDPRLKPKLRNHDTCSQSSEISQTVSITKDNFLQFSSIWDSNVREQLSNKLSNSDLNKLREKLTISGAEPDLKEKEARIPLIIINKCGNQYFNSSSKKATNCLGYGYGLEIIIPFNWGMPFWLSFIHNNARAIGNNNMVKIGQLTNNISINFNLQPDTNSGKIFEEINSGLQEDKFHRMPPAKRCNYKKLKYFSPFKRPWQELINLWQDTFSDSFYVLRDKIELNQISKILSIKEDLNSQEINNVLLQKLSCLLLIKVVATGKGCLSDASMICLPIKEDFKGSLIEESVNSSEDVTINCSSRKIIGYICSGGFSYGIGKSTGLGFVVLRSICSLLFVNGKSRPVSVLVRSKNSLTFRFAKMTLLL